MGRIVIHIDAMETSEEHQLEIEQELQIHGSVGGFSIQLIEGLAEIYGAELVLNKIYKFPLSVSIAVYTFHGARIKITGTNVVTSVETDTHKILDINLHAYLQERREIAEKGNQNGPVTLVVGPADTGKSTLSRLLLNYAARMGRKPFYIDLDVGQNSLSIPGTMSLVRVEKTADIVDGFEQGFPIQVYFYGYKTPSEIFSYYLLLIKKMGKVIEDRLAQMNPNARSSGVIINSCGWTRGPGYNAITFTALAFKIDTLVVMEDERLYKELKKDMPFCVDVLYMPKNSGIVERSRHMRIQSREQKIREYFYGSSGALTPFTIEIPYSELKILRVFLNDESDNFSMDLSEENLRLSEVPIGLYLLNRILGVTTAGNVSIEMALKNIMGFVCVTAVDLNAASIKVLSPSPEPLPSQVLLLGAIEFGNVS